MAPTPQLSASLEDYLETVYELVRDQKVARVRDIACARGVRAASVTVAMRKLGELGLIRYEKREFIDLTPEGQRQAQRIFSRHQVLTRFFAEILQMPARSAAADACAMEHCMSPEGMDHMVRFFEFLRASPDGGRLLAGFHAGSRRERASAGRASDRTVRGQSPRPVSVGALTAGARARVVHVDGVGALRDRLLDLGLLPDVMVDVLAVPRGAGRAGQVALRVQGFEVRLSGEEAQAVQVVGAEESS